MILLATAVWVEVLQGKAVGIADGDTIMVLDAPHQQHRIRLAGIDAPQDGQPYTRRARHTFPHSSFPSPCASSGISATVTTDWLARYGHRRAHAFNPIGSKSMGMILAMLLVVACHFKRDESEQAVEYRERYAPPEKTAQTKKQDSGWMRTL